MIVTIVGKVLFSLLIFATAITGGVLWAYGRLDDVHIFERIIIRACACLFWIFALVQVVRWVVA